MSPIREAIVLPLLFLGVTLVAAARPGGDVVLQAPSLASLIVAVALMALLVRSGTLAAERLIAPSRSPLANANGVVVLLTLFAASSGLVTLVVPHAGLPALLGWILLVSLFVQAFAIDPDRVHVLRGLMVTFGAAFTIKFVVLAALSAPVESRFGRVLQTLFDGITLGSISQPPLDAAAGYLAFLAIAMYLIGLALLPAAGWRTVRMNVKQLNP